MPPSTVNPHARPALVAQVRQLMSGPQQLGLNAACAQLRLSPASVSRWMAKLDAAGAIVDGKPTGRPGMFDRMTEEECAALRHWKQVKGSLELAIEFFAEDPACSLETRIALQGILDKSAQARRQAAIPPSLRRAGTTTDVEDAMFRGRKNFSQREMVERKGMFYRDSLGRVLPMLPNSIFESDDMSSNEPFRFVGADGLERLGRQSLFTCDVFSANPLAFDALGRDRDAYRVEDIAEHMLQVVQAWGLPMVWRLERGVWENQWLHGIDLGGGKTWGGLGELFHIEHTWKTGGKGTVESMFDLLQSLIAGQSMTIGRKRGEFEEGTRHYLRANNMTSSPETRADSLRHFWGINAYAAAMAEACERFAQRAKKRLAFGQDMVIPRELYSTAVKRECPADQLWRFAPIKKIATVRRDVVEVTESVHYRQTYRFRCNGIHDGMYLPHGLKVGIAFHPGHPEQGCHVFSLDTSALNRQAWPVGQPLVLAEYMPLRLNIDLSSESGDFSGRKKANAHVRKETRAIRQAGGAVQRGTSTARDGLGNALVVATGGGRADTLSAGGERSGGAVLGGSAHDRHSTRRSSFDEAAEIQRLEAELMRRGELDHALTD